MIFNNVQKIQYDSFIIRNLLTPFGDIFNEIRHEYVLQEYSISGSPRPEELSYTLYKDTDYEWTLLLVNNIIDPYHGWIRQQDTIYQTAEILYSDIYANHHHYDPVTDIRYFDLVEYPNESKEWFHTGDIEYTNPQFIGDLVPVTNIEYELEQNEKMRDILIVPPKQIDNFVTRILGLVNERNSKRY